MLILSSHSTPLTAEISVLNSPLIFHLIKLNLLAKHWAMLSQLNDYDLKMVCADIIQICANPNANNSIKHSRNPLRRLWRTKYPFRNYHF